MLKGVLAHLQGACLLGKTARLPLVADAADQQVPF